jgi:hydroxymethylglutaryl-CoA reductase
MTDSSRIPGFYKLSLDERRQTIAEKSSVPYEQLAQAVASGGLDPVIADKVVENVLGVYGMPFGIALNVRINGTDRLVPMVVEEPSVIAAASNASRMIRASGGFHAEMVESLMTAQVQLFQVPDSNRAIRVLEAHQHELLELARQAAPGLLRYGGGPNCIEVRDLGHGDIVLHLLVDCQDAMGANLVNSMAEAIGPRAAELSGGSASSRTFAIDAACVRPAAYTLASCCSPAPALETARALPRPIWREKRLSIASSRLRASPKSTRIARPHTTRAS